MKKVYLPIPGAPVEALLAYLHSKMLLTEAFDLSIDPMLQPLTTEKIYHCEKLDGKMQTAYWIHKGYGFITNSTPNKEGIPLTPIVDILGPSKIMLHGDGFFNNEKTACEFWISPGSTVVPFTQQNFADLKLSAPESDALATCILAENSTLGLVKSCMLKMQGIFILEEMHRIFGKEIWQHFSQLQLAGYLGITKNYMCELRAGM